MVSTRINRGMSSLSRAIKMKIYRKTSLIRTGIANWLVELCHHVDKNCKRMREGIGMREVLEWRDRGCIMQCWLTIHRFSMIFGCLSLRLASSLVNVLKIKKMKNGKDNRMWWKNIWWVAPCIMVPILAIKSMRTVIKMSLRKYRVRLSWKEVSSMRWAGLSTRILSKARLYKIVRRLIVKMGWKSMLPSLRLKRKTKSSQLR